MSDSTWHTLDINDPTTWPKVGKMIVVYFHDDSMDFGLVDETEDDSGHNNWFNDGCEMGTGDLWLELPPLPRGE